LAEELAHFLIHRQVYAVCQTIEDRLRIEEMMDERTRDHLESNARALASAVLMPKSTIERFVEELAGTLVDEHGHVWVEDLISEVARAYDVNFSAAKRRLRNLGYHHSDRLGLNLS
jgi:Zn-dependent peptidase ImmA (M78 family)